MTINNQRKSVQLNFSKVYNVHMHQFFLAKKQIRDQHSGQSRIFPSKAFDFLMYVQFINFFLQFAIYVL